MNILELNNDIMKQMLKDLEYKRDYNKLVKEVYSEWRIETTQDGEDYIMDLTLNGSIRRYVLNPENYWEELEELGVHYTEQLIEETRFDKKFVDYTPNFPLKVDYGSVESDDY